MNKINKTLILTAITATLTTLTACHHSTNTQPVSPSSTVWDSSAYGGVDKSYDTRLLKLREQMLPRFQTLSFTDPVNGVVMQYNLYTPKGYQANAGKKYPLVMFIADSSTVGKGVQAPLLQGYGGIIWATDEVQNQHPAFVLVPAFKDKAVHDDWSTNDEVDTVFRLYQSIMANYPIDDKRLYTTGQSMGGMISFYLNSKYPDFFTASMFVGSQWDTNVLTPLAKSKFIYTVSAADPKASVGMNELGEMLLANGAGYTQSQFSARLPSKQQNAIVAKQLEQNQPINFIRFEPNTVVPDGITHKGGEHMYSFDYAYLLKPARDWLLSQSK